VKPTSTLIPIDGPAVRPISPGPDEVIAFRAAILEHYLTHGRDLPWRRTRDPYKVLVSEMMLQQTQVGRVIEKYGPFVERFGDFTALAGAPLVEVLALWKGLGYNRRALFLSKIARIVVDYHGGVLPESPQELARLPGIGPNTAGAIAAFAFNRPVVFVETNIRAVFIHRFFEGSDRVRDDEILPLVAATLDREDPRRWYWALMDYGAALKAQGKNPGRRSAHYVRQAPFWGSDREIRGAILGLLIRADADNGGDGLTGRTIVSTLTMDAARIRKNLAALIDEGFIVKVGRHYRIR
jgi:A/G-specific adenine glycosylase